MLKRKNSVFFLKWTSRTPSHSVALNTLTVTSTKNHDTGLKQTKDRTIRYKQQQNRKFPLHFHFLSLNLSFFHNTISLLPYSEVLHSVFVVVFVFNAYRENKYTFCFGHDRQTVSKSRGKRVPEGGGVEGEEGQ